MSPPPKNKNALKDPADRRTAPAIHVRPTLAERKIILRWAAGTKLSRKCLGAILQVAQAELAQATNSQLPTPTAQTAPHMRLHQIQRLKK